MKPDKVLQQKTLNIIKDDQGQDEEYIDSKKIKIRPNSAGSEYKTPEKSVNKALNS